MLPVLPARLRPLRFASRALVGSSVGLPNRDLGNKCRGGFGHSGSLPESYVGAHGSACGTVVQMYVRRMAWQTVACAIIVLQGPFEWQRHQWADSPTLSSGSLRGCAWYGISFLVLRKLFSPTRARQVMFAISVSFVIQWILPLLGYCHFWFNACLFACGVFLPGGATVYPDSSAAPIACVQSGTSCQRKSSPDAVDSVACVRTEGLNARVYLSRHS
jgi:hypothetical protein